MKPFSILDPQNHITLKVKPSIQKDKSLLIILELFYLDEKNKTMKGDLVEFFLNESDVDYIIYIYQHKLISNDGYKLTRGKNGTARGFKLTHTASKFTAGHLSLTLVNGTGTNMSNGFTSLKKVEQKIILNLTFEQSIKLLKYLERAVLVYSLKFEMEGN